MLFAITLAGCSIEMAVLTQRANRERLKAEREATFLADMFRAASPLGGERKNDHRKRTPRSRA